MTRIMKEAMFSFVVRAYWRRFFGKFIIMYFTDSEEPLVKKIMNRIATLLSEKPVIECISKINKLVFDFKGLVIYPLQYQAFLDGDDLKLSKYEFEILLLLASSAGQVFSKTQIYQTVWGQELINC